MSDFDLCDLHNIKLYLNSNYYPYDNLLGSKELMYRMFCDFAPSYYNLPLNIEHDSEIDFGTFTKTTPIIVIDCSHQSEHLKTSTDIRVEFEFSTAVAAQTTAYCLIVSDSLLEYTPLTSMVREVQ
jgi:hypothetical protein